LEYEGVRSGRSRRKRATLIWAMRQYRPMKYLLSIASDAMDSRRFDDGSGFIGSTEENSNIRCEKALRRPV